jgi:mannosylglucosylglycerate synthase
LKRIALLHYASSPNIGGVESTITHHATALAKLGYNVRIISGTPEAASDNSNALIETYTNSLFGSTDPAILRVTAKLERGEVSESFHQLVGRLSKELAPILSDCDVWIVHNILTLNKNLPLTAALASLQTQTGIQLIGWCHDLAPMNQRLNTELFITYPWRLLSTQWHNTTYVTVSEPRRYELAQRLHMPPENIHVVPPGIDPVAFYRWTPTMQTLDSQLHLLDSDGVLFIPARLMRSKNIALGLQIFAEVRHQSDKDFRLIVSGPPELDTPNNQGYLDELLTLRHTLKIEPFAHFLYELGQGDEPFIPDDATMSNLFQFADALLFPSTQEGFGIPVLEAGLAGLPIFCTDIPTLRASGQNGAYYFDPTIDTPTGIAERLLNVLEINAIARLKVKVRQSHRWDVIVREQVIPLIES